MAAAAVDASPELPHIPSLEEINTATALIKPVRLTNVKFLPQLFSTTLYEDTLLHRPGPRRFVQPNEVPKKNVYFLALKTVEVSDALLNDLTEGEVLTEEERDAILAHPTKMLRAVQLYLSLLEKEDPDQSIAEQLINTLSNHQNTEVVEIFSRFVIRPGAQGGRRPRQSEGFGNGRWACKHCTLINSADTNICVVCHKSVGFDLADTEQVNICPICTLMNDYASATCDACGFQFTQLPGRAPAMDTPEQVQNQGGAAALEEVSVLEGAAAAFGGAFGAAAATLRGAAVALEGAVGSYTSTSEDDGSEEEGYFNFQPPANSTAMRTPRQPPPPVRVPPRQRRPVRSPVRSRRDNARLIH